MGRKEWHDSIRYDIDESVSWDEFIRARVLRTPFDYSIFYERRERRKRERKKKKEEERRGKRRERKRRMKRKRKKKKKKKKRKKGRKRKKDVLKMKFLCEQRKNNVP